MSSANCQVETLKNRAISQLQIIIKSDVDIKWSGIILNMVSSTNVLIYHHIWMCSILFRLIATN